MKKCVMIMFLAGLFIVISSLNIVAQSSTVEVEFYNDFVYPFCYIQNDFETFWQIGDELLDSRTSTLPAVGCYNDSGFPGSTCCPITAAYCDIPTGNCLDKGEISCGKITDPTDCKNAVPAIPKNDLEGTILEVGACGRTGDPWGNQGCFKYVGCRCEWDGACKAVIDNQILDTDDPANPGGKFYNDSNDPALTAACGNQPDSGIGKCEFDFNVVDNCETLGYLQRGWVANWNQPGIGPAYCKSGDDRVPCLDVVRLGFFGWVQVIIAAALIIIIYLVIKKKGK